MHSLIQIDPGTLSGILPFLDVQDLLCTECTCKTLRSLLNPLAWDLLEARNKLENDDQLVGQSGAVTSKDRAIRQYKAKRYAERMEHLAEQHFHYYDDK